MTNVDKLREEEIETLSKNTDDEVMELDQILTEGVNAKIPFSFTYPNTDKKVGVMVRPLSSNEYTTAMKKSKQFKSNFLTEILKIGLYRMNGDEFPKEQIDELPAGVVVMISNEISRISGVDLAESVEVNQRNMIEDMMGF